jgi:hypothetical protein
VRPQPLDEFRSLVLESLKEEAERLAPAERAAPETLPQPKIFATE